MKKIIFTVLFASSTLLFAKTETPKLKSDLPKEENKVLVAKKTIKSKEKEVKKIALTTKEMEVHPCVAASVIPLPYSGPALVACINIIVSSLRP